MPVAKLFPEAIKELFQHHPDAELAWVGDNPYAYWSLFVQLWKENKPFVIVEHDIVIGDMTIRNLEDCDSRWCAATYHEAPGEPVSGLGCTKLVPSGDVGFSTFPEQVWQNVDTTVAGLLTTAGWRVHEHGPWLRHLNPRVAAQQEARNDQ